MKSRIRLCLELTENCDRMSSEECSTKKPNYVNHAAWRVPVPYVRRVMTWMSLKPMPRQSRSLFHWALLLLIDLWHLPVPKRSLPRLRSWPNAWDSLAATFQASQFVFALIAGLALVALFACLLISLNLPHKKNCVILMRVCEHICTAEPRMLLCSHS